MKSPTTSAKLLAASAVGQRADQEILLSAVAVEQSLERGHQRHEEGDASRPRHPFETIGQGLIQLEAEGRPAVRLGGRPQVIRRQVQDRQLAVQLLPPESPQLLAPRASQHVALPAHEVRVAELGLRQAGAGARLFWRRRAPPAPRPSATATSRRPLCDAR